ncbi:radical SAM protein [Terasakiella sp. SH-1]|uniref:radical SAM/SPASM domain-containing protein n=1 Tax=Terasakiella sp. SH-1 TaxID=2560057 RepID=UPI0010742F4F|nr:radical SAM protein [Terasakiella sp. SH-1]
MSFKDHMDGYYDLRTLYQVDSLYALKHGQYTPPILVEIDPMNKCNQECLYCYAYGRGGEESKLKDDAFLNLFKQLADTGVQTVLFQGTGEPLAHRKATEAIEEAAKYGLTVGINSNGVLFTPQMQDRVLKDIFYIKFSVIDHNKERYTKLHVCPDNHWDKLHENMTYAIELRKREKLGVALWATVYLDEDNFHDAYDIVKFYKEMGLDYIVIQEATYSEYSPAGVRPYASTHFTAEEIAETKEKVLSLNTDDFVVKFVFPFINDDINHAGQTPEGFVPHFCQGPKLYTTICSDGEVYPCWRLWGRGKEFSCGNIYEQSFEEIWKGKKRQELEEYINTVPPCGDECKVCNHARLNEILYKFLNADSPWKGFII